MINLITRISVIGITTITASLIILLSAFNGIEQMIEKLYSEFDTDITIRVKEGKRFNDSRINMEAIRNTDGVANLTRALEEVVILKHEKKWANANLLGVDSSFLEITHTSEHMVDGDAVLRKKGKDYALIGASLLDKLEGFIPENAGHESLICYAPKNNLKIRPGRSPFIQKVVKLSGRVNYNREVNMSTFIMPFDLAKEVLNSGSQLSAIYVDAAEGVSNETLKERLMEVVGPDFDVKTNFEKNELIYRTSKSEKVIVLIILLFIFVLAAFNLVASLTMLFVEKLQNIKTMNAFGANRGMIFNIFFLEGLLISFKGIFFGFIIGYAICFAQIKYALVTMPNSGGEAFPVSLNVGDGLLIFFLVAALSTLFSFMPVKYLIRKNL